MRKISGITLGLKSGIILFVFLICDVNLFHFNYRMNADIASDVVLCELIWKSKEFVPDTWYVANEARIICTPNVAALFYGVFHNMSLSAGLACCVMTLMILFSILYFARAAGLEKKEGLLMGLMGLALPSNFVSLELLYLFASYYAVHVVILFVTLAAYVKAIQEKSIEAWLCVFLAFILGMQGVRGILIIYGPLLGIEMLRNIDIVLLRKNERFHVFPGLWAVMLLASSFLGTCFPVSVGQGFSRNIRNGFQKLLTVVLPDMGRAIGFESTNAAGKACLSILLVLSLWILADILRRVWKGCVIELVEWAWLVICCSPVITALTVAFTTVESSQRYYFMLLFLMGFSVVLALKKDIGKWKAGICAAAALLAVLTVYSVYFPVLSAKEPPDSDLYEVTKFLEENEYRTAYATFENANTMTVLSNGKVRVYPVATVEKMNVCKWMSSTKWYCPNVPYNQKTAYIVTVAEREAFGSFLMEKEGLLYGVAQIGKFSIYVSDYNFSNLGD